ncbi:MAG: type I polyketide synthase, partial [Planctomycetes bacterium]|nr:type I polyketide synthase [Planctomycetota bacterium]
AYSEQQLQALRTGDLAACFGPQFSNLAIKNPVTIPDGRMRLVHRIKELTPNGGRFGLGLIVGEADIHPDDWFLTCHFCDDMVMPGTLMYECCLHTLRVYLLRMGWIGDAADIHYEPIEGISSILKCRGQVLQSTKMVTYELCIQEIGYRGDDQTPYVIADALMYGDGKAIVHMKNMSMQLSGISQSDIDALWSGSDYGNQKAISDDPDFTAQEALYNDQQIIAYAEGKPSEAFGDKYLAFDNERKIARLPRAPFKFINRITQIRDCAAWEMESGGTIVARYDVPVDAWYFDSNEQNTKNNSYKTMPFAVLLETALQPCGWMAAYVGSALSAEHDLKFRNLGGKATQYIDITPDIGTLSTKIHMSNVSSSGGMVIQNYDMEMWCDQGLVYKGDTVFGFFSTDALATQIGIRDAKIHQPTDEEIDRAHSFDYPSHSPFPDAKMCMIEKVTHCDLAGGSKGLGFLEGIMEVDPEAWFFQAHFYQDPVIPGSLGLESFQQLLKVAAWELWSEPNKSYHFDSMPLGHQHTWLYRGQVIPKDNQVTVKAELTSIDHERKQITANGYLVIDGRVIYQMIQFAIVMRELV